jgi:mannosyltransferase
MPESMDRRWIILITVVAVAAIFRLPRLTRESFWQDEVLTAKSASASFSEALSIVRQSENAPPLYFLLLNRWAAVFGSSDLALRLPSALAGIAAVVVLSQLCRRLFKDAGQTAGLWAAAMLAVQPYHIGYSMEARPYALAFLLALWSCNALAAILTLSPGHALPLSSAPSPGRSAQISYVIASTAMIWTHSFCAFVLLAQNLVALPLLWRRPSSSFRIRQWLVLQGAVLVLLAPWVHQAMDVYRIGAPWIERVSVIATMLVHSGGMPFLVIWLTLGTVAVIAGRKREPRGLLLAVSVWLVPVVVPIVISALDRPMFVPRYAIVALIGIHVLCGYAAAAASRTKPWLGTVLGGAVVAAGLWTSIPLLIDGATVLRRPDVRSAAGVIDQHARLGDAVWPSTVYYWPAINRYTAGRGLWRVDSLVQLAELPTAPPTLWMIVAEGETEPSVDGYTVVERRPLQGLTLVRSGRTAPPKVE